MQEKKQTHSLHLQQRDGRTTGLPSPSGGSVGSGDPGAAESVMATNSQPGTTPSSLPRNRSYRAHQNRTDRLLERLPVKLKVDVTFPKPVTREEVDTVLREALNAIQAYHRAAVEYVVGFERMPARHLHITLFSHVELYEPWVTEAFHGQTINAMNTTAVKVTRYSPGGRGISYSMKHQDSDCAEDDVRFSRNLDMLSPEGLTSSRRQMMNSKERRLLRRIQQQGHPGKRPMDVVGVNVPRLPKTWRTSAEQLLSDTSSARRFESR